MFKTNIKERSCNEDSIQYPIIYVFVLCMSEIMPIVCYYALVVMAKKGFVPSTEDDFIEGQELLNHTETGGSGKTTLTTDALFSDGKKRFNSWRDWI